MVAGIRDGDPSGEAVVVWACAANHLTALAANHHAAMDRTLVLPMAARAPVGRATAFYRSVRAS